MLLKKFFIPSKVKADKLDDLQFFVVLQAVIFGLVVRRAAVLASVIFVTLILWGWMAP
jgi:hypothetical protein